MAKRVQPLLAKKKQSSKFQLGDIVYLPNRYKAPVGVSTLIKPHAQGPYKILRIRDNNVYLTNLVTKKNISEHISKLKKINIEDIFLELDKGNIGELGNFFPKDTHNLTSKKVQYQDDNQGIFGSIFDSDMIQPTDFMRREEEIAHGEDNINHEDDEVNQEDDDVNHESNEILEGEDMDEDSMTKRPAHTYNLRERKPRSV